jgi:hypothetical protein
MIELSRLPAMPAGVRLVSWALRAAPINLNPWATVVDVDLFVRATLAQLDARLHSKKWLAGCTLNVLLDRLAACGCRIELDDPTKALQ